MKKLVRFVLLIIFMMLINLIVDLIAISFVKGYENYVWGHFYFFDSLIFISMYSIFQIFVFPSNKKYREYIIPTCTLLLFSYLLFGDDPDGFGFEIAYIIGSLTSKIISLLSYVIVDYIANDSIRINIINILYSLGYSVYLLIAFSFFKNIMKRLESKFPLSLVFKPHNNKLNHTSLHT
jgi:hypothetical protein